VARVIDGSFNRSSWLREIRTASTGTEIEEMIMRYRKTSRSALAVIASLLIWLDLGMATRAQTYPSRPIHFVVPVPPAGPNDFVARLLASQMSNSMGQPVSLRTGPDAVDGRQWSTLGRRSMQRRN
jgi:hypothetical protein